MLRIVLVLGQQRRIAVDIERQERDGGVTASPLVVGDEVLRRIHIEHPSRLRRSACRLHKAVRHGPLTGPRVAISARAFAGEPSPGPERPWSGDVAS